MNKLWLVLKREYLRHVLRKRFIFAILSVPIFIVFIVGVGFLSAYLGSDFRPVGYVDQSGEFANAQPLPQKGSKLFPDVKFQAYDSIQVADQALQKGTIQGYFQIEPDYAQTGAVKLVSEKDLDSDVTSIFYDFLLSNLVSNQPQNLRQRLINGPDVIVHTTNQNRTTNANNPFVFLVATFAGIIFIIAINTSGGYLMRAVVEEKENRTMEIILTSVSPTQLMAGKIIGNLSVGLTQLLIWTLAGVAGIVVALQVIPGFTNPGIDPAFVWLLIAAFLPAFVMLAALMAMIGATATEAREAQQVAGLFTIPIILPLWFASAIIQSPNSPLSIGFSLFPLTAPMTLPMRATLTTLPAWQIAASLGILVVCAVGAIWLASRAFHLGLLRYGKKIRLTELFHRPLPAGNKL